MIHAQGLAHEFRVGRGRKRLNIRAVDGIDLDVRPGEVVGLLGPNGAGKTTMMRMLTTLLRPTRGTANVAGHDVVRAPEQVRRCIGYVSQTGGTSSYARAGDEVIDRGLMYGGRRGPVEKRARQLFDQLQLDGMWDRTPRQMSGGQRRRLDLAMGLVHEPLVALLDEPTAGLDPQARANLWGHIEDLRSNRGVTVLLTTHYLDEADALSDRIVIVDEGRIIASDTPEVLKAAVSGDLVSVFLANAVDAPRAAEHLSGFVAAGAGRARGVEIDGRWIRGRVTRAGTVVPGLLSSLAGSSIAIESLEVRRPTLDDVFLSLTGRSLRDSDGSTTASSTSELHRHPEGVAR